MNKSQTKTGSKSCLLVSFMCPLVPLELLHDWQALVPFDDVLPGFMPRIQKTSRKSVGQSLRSGIHVGLQLFRFDLAIVVGALHP